MWGKQAQNGGQARAGRAPDIVRRCDGGAYQEIVMGGTGSAPAGSPVTREQIQGLMNDADAMCDVLQVAVCELALGRPVSPEARGQLSGAERAKLGRLTQHAAWAECERAIAAR